MTLLKTHSRAKEMRESARRERTRPGSSLGFAVVRLPVSSHRFFKPFVRLSLLPLISCEGNKNTAAPSEWILHILSLSFLSLWLSLAVLVGSSCNRTAAQLKFLLMHLEPCLFMNQLVCTVDSAGSPAKEL